MQRGILTLTKEQLNQLLTVLDINIFNGTQLYEKLNSALQSKEENVQILISEDEIEKILDELGPPVYEDLVVNSVIQKISDLMVTFRQ